MPGFSGGITAGAGSADPTARGPPPRLTISVILEITGTTTFELLARSAMGAARPSRATRLRLGFEPCVSVLPSAILAPARSNRPPGGVWHPRRVFSVAIAALVIGIVAFLFAFLALVSAGAAHTATLKLREELNK